MERPLLTKRQVEVLRGAAYGLSTVGIAKHLGIGTSSVKTHLKRICDTLNAKNRTNAVALGFRWGYLIVPELEWQTNPRPLPGEPIRTFQQNSQTGRFVTPTTTRRSGRTSRSSGGRRMSARRITAILTRPPSTTTGTESRASSTITSTIR